MTVLTGAKRLVLRAETVPIGFVRNTSPSAQEQEHICHCNLQLALQLIQVRNASSNRPSFALSKWDFLPSAAPNDARLPDIRPHSPISPQLLEAVASRNADALRQIDLQLTNLRDAPVADRAVGPLTGVPWTFPDATTPSWYYVDPAGRFQGPFPLLKLAQWCDRGLLRPVHSDLLACHW